MSSLKKLSISVIALILFSSCRQHEDSIVVFASAISSEVLFNLENVNINDINVYDEDGSKIATDIVIVSDKKYLRTHFPLPLRSKSKFTRDNLNAVCYSKIHIVTQTQRIEFIGIFNYHVVPNDNFLGNSQIYLVDVIPQDSGVNVIKSGSGLSTEFIISFNQ